MSFISYEFLVFLVLVMALYFRRGHRFQNRMLLVASYVFYGWWDPRFLILIFVSSVVDFVCGLWLDAHRYPSRPESERRLVLTLSLFTNLGILGFFKYFGFFSASFCQAVAHLGFSIDPMVMDIVLPVGISFYTLQTMSYTIDVYRGKLASTTRFLDFLLYVSFFPQLVAGPIERATDLLPQVLAPRLVSRPRGESGFHLALVGFFKKMVIADSMALIVDRVFAVGAPTRADVILGSYAFALQIYGDFSGYTDIARGVARVFGFNIGENFVLPYLATNPSDFWRRWHVSLSTWLRDYLYIPMGGSRHGAFRTVRNLVVTMFLGGLWHGASWNFVLWGLFHGLLLGGYHVLVGVVGHRSKPDEKGMGALFWVKVVAFFHLTCFGWLIFRSSSLAQLSAISRALIAPAGHGVSCVSPILVLLPLLLLGIFQAYQYRTGQMEPWTTWPAWIQVLFYVSLFYGIVFLSPAQSHAFIYFQF